MKAITRTSYGGPEVLAYGDVAVPTVGPDDALVQVRFASVNPYDWHLLRGEPYLVRATSGLRRPKVPGLGVDAAGVVTAVGANVTEVAVGDEVLGGFAAAFAEYVRGPAAKLVAKPPAVSFEAAAAIPIAGVTALQALRDAGRLASGQRVVVNGAGGGVGTFAVQIAVALGAEVTAVCSAAKAEVVSSLGATRVLDYAVQDFCSGADRVDLVVDCVGNRSVRDLRRAVTQTGTIVIAGGGSGKWIGPLALPMRAKAVSPFVSQRLTLCSAKLARADLAELASMAAAGTVAPVVATTFALADAASAIRHLESGHALGKTVLSVG